MISIVLFARSVLILTPSSENKLFAEWLGPHKIIRKLENNNYEVQLPKRKRVLHINMLKRFYERGAIIESVLMAEGDEEEENTDFPEVLELGREGKEKEIKNGEHLQEHYKDELKALFAEYTDVFSDYLRKTDFIKCKLTLKDESPCKQAPS